MQRASDGREPGALFLTRTNGSTIMANALWMILYQLDPARVDEYLHWFHEVHVAEKLARPGYTWAAHYRAGEARDDSATYVAMFGAGDSRVFYDPSPAQIKPRQTPETREMMACRRDSRMLILAEEWVRCGNPAARLGDAAVGADWINLALCDANGNDEAFGAWLAQDYLPAIGEASTARKYLTSTGEVRHLLIQEPDGSGSMPPSIVDRADHAWPGAVPGYLSFPLGLPLVARRVWPAPG